MQLASGLPTFAPLPAVMPTEIFGKNQSTAPLTESMAPEDARAFERAAEILRHSPTGADILDRMIDRKAKIVVDSPEAWRAHGYHDSVVAVTTLADDTIRLQRSVLNDPKQLMHNAVVIAHEGVHLLDELEDVDKKWMDAVNHDYNIYLRRGDAQSAANLVQNARLTQTVVSEARAYIAGGKVARELDDPAIVDNEYGRVAARAEDPNSQQTWHDTQYQILRDRVYNPLQLETYPPDWER